MSKKVLCVIDVTTGTVVAADNLFVVQASETAVRRAESNDAAAYALAMKSGRYIDIEVLQGIVDRKSIQEVLKKLKPEAT
jgi:hypothetical protein